MVTSSCSWMSTKVPTAFNGVVEVGVAEAGAFAGGASAVRGVAGGRPAMGASAAAGAGC